MDFSLHLSRTQCPLFCPICETGAKIRLKCIDCELLMCIKCFEKVHQRFENGKNHKIVDIKDIGMHATEMLDFINIQCQDHSGQNCCLFCEPCNRLVCPLCVSKTHRKHDLLEIRKGYDITLNKLKQAKVKDQSNLQRLNQHSLKIEEQLRSNEELYRDNKKNVQAQNIALKKAVDQFTEQMNEKVEELYTSEKKSHKEIQIQVNKLKEKIEDQIPLFEDIITGKDAAKVFIEGGKLEQSLTEEFKLPLFVSQADSTFYPGKIQITQEVFGKIGKRKDLEDL